MKKHDRIQKKRCKIKEEGKKMAVLAKPKSNSYIVKKESAQKIINSSNTKADKKAIQERVVQFKRNNLKKK